LSRHEVTCRRKDVPITPNHHQVSNEEKAELDGQHMRMLRSHVHQCLQDIWDTPELVLDDDGDVPFRYGCSSGWILLHRHPDPSVEIRAHAAHSVRRSAKLLSELNTLNQASHRVQVSFDGKAGGASTGVVVVRTSISWAGVNRESVRAAFHTAGMAADTIGPMIAAAFDGETPYPVDEERVDGDAG
jgi:hypothetical protein